MHVIKGFPGHPSADDQIFLGELTLVSAGVFSRAETQQHKQDKYK